MNNDGILDAVTEDHGYPVEEGQVEVAEYLAGHVDRDNELILIRMGNSDGTILEAPLWLDEAEGVIRALKGNISELTQVIGLDSDDSDEILSAVAAAVSGAITDGDYPVMQLLVRWIEQADLWADFASWAAQVVEDGSTYGAPDNG